MKKLSALYLTALVLVIYAIGVAKFGAVVWRVVNSTNAHLP